jgi:hypothetical protein
VIAEHKCGAAIPANGPSIKNPAPRIARSDELCPY